jgi:hypothetical protein
MGLELNDMGRCFLVALGHDAGAEDGAIQNRVKRALEFLADEAGARGIGKVEHNASAGSRQHVDIGT